MQLACPECKMKLFYVMLQDDGSVEAYCSSRNHKVVLVNVPNLVKHILYSGEEKSKHENTGTDATTSDHTTAAKPTE